MRFPRFSPTLHLVSRSAAVQAAEIRMSELGLTQEALAAEAGVDPTTVNAFLKGRNWPQPRTRAKLEVALKWNVGTLSGIAGGDEPPRSLRTMDAEQLRRLIHEAEDELAFLNPRYESTRRVISARLQREISELKRQLQSLDADD